jgi:Spy/CpxP family protein refolding chaperone
MRSLVGGLVLALVAGGAVQAQDEKGKRERSKDGEQRERGQGGRGGQGGFGGFGGFGGGFGGGMMGMPGGATMLLGMAEVQKELSVTDEQKGLIDDMLADLREEGRNLFSGFQGFREMSEADREKAMKDIRTKGEALGKKGEEMTSMILEPAQLERLGQLRLQSEGTGALLRADLAEKLKLTQEQKDKIAKLNEEAQPRFNFGGGGAGGAGGAGGTGGAGGGIPNFREMTEEQRAEFRERMRVEGEKMRERVEKARADMIAVLSPEQKETFEKMQGKKFEFPQPRGFGGQGGPGGAPRREGGERRKEAPKKDQ